MPHTAAFVPFPSIANASERQLNLLKKLAPACIENALWVGCEKIHGCNLSVEAREAEQVLRMASRHQYLGEGASFHNHDKVMKPYLPRFAALVQGIRVSVHADVRVQVVGELFGGMYPGQSQVKNEGSVMRVNEIYYSPRREFRAFALFIAGERIKYDDRAKWFSRFDIPFVKARVRGKLSELLASDSIFPSEIYKEYGLQPLQGNDAEGMVLEPVEPQSYLMDESERSVMLKYKHPKHRETRTQLPVPLSADSTCTFNAALSDDMIDSAVSFVNAARLGSVMSKRTEIIDQNVPHKVKLSLVFALVQDAWKDLESHCSETYFVWKRAQKQLRAAMVIRSQEIVENYIKTLNMNRVLDVNEHVR
jgi:Rnl2 family RNA ligase